MKKLKDDDYLMEITVRVAVRRRDAAKVIALDPTCEVAETEEDGVLSAVYDIVDDALVQHEDLISLGSSRTERVPTVALFEDVDTLGSDFPEQESANHNSSQTTPEAGTNIGEPLNTISCRPKRK
jgi:hypothetical protein